MASNSQPEIALKVSVGLAATVAGLWLWHCWCVFPYHSWNELRLVPSFLWAQGASIYASAHGGLASTWIYGPIPVILLWPATQASSAASALQTAGIINSAITVVAIGIFCLKSASLSNTSSLHRFAAVVACLALWPRSAFQYIQADNFAIAFGLLGNVLLLQATRRRALLWMASGCAVLAVACKQTSMEAAAAQLLWIGIVAGRHALLCHAMRIAVCAALLAGIILLVFDLRSLWFTLVVLPGNLPWSNFGERMLEQQTTLFLQLLVPAIVLAVGRKQIFQRESPLLLPALCSICSLAPGLAGLFKIGGSSNSLHTVQYLLPAIALWAMPRLATNLHFRPALACMMAVITLFPLGRFVAMPVKVWIPLTQHLDQANFLTRQLPDQIWFPWNPLVTFYAEKRFDHSEDGLQIRLFAGKPVSTEELAVYLPRKWHVIAMRTTEKDWSLAKSLPPKSAAVTTFGLWSVQSWQPPAATAAPMGSEVP